MRAARLVGYNRPFEIDVIPDPVLLDPTDVIVKVGAAGFCRTDIHLWSGEFASFHEQAGIEALPFVCGHENAGWVVEVGAAVQHIAVGDAVLLHPQGTCGYCHACRAGDDMHCSAPIFPGLSAQGGFAEYVRSNARAVVPIPPELGPLDVVALADGGLTAYRAVKRALPLAYPGTTTVVIGAGGLGHIGIQALRALSQTEIIVVDRSERALEHALAWGADKAVLSRSDHSHVAEIRDHTNGVGANVVIDYVGEGGAELEAIDMLGPNGVDIVAGYGGTLIANIQAKLLTPEASVVGTIVGTYNELVELVHLTRRGAVKPEWTTFPLEGVNDAMAALEAGKITGRGVLVPGNGP